MQCQVGDYPAATASHTRALRLYRGLGSRIGEENALAYLAVVQRSTGDHLAADASLRSALTIAKSVGDQLGEANVLTELGMVQPSTGDRSGASASVAEALAITRAIDDRIGEAEALNCLGALLLDAPGGDAVVHHRSALRIARDIQCPLEEARAGGDRSVSRPDRLPG